MGNCNCIDERSDKDVHVESFPTTTLKPKKEQTHAGASDASATSFELVQPHQDDAKSDQARQGQVIEVPILEEKIEHYEKIVSTSVPSRKSQADPSTNPQPVISLQDFSSEKPAPVQSLKPVPVEMVRALQGACRILLAKQKLHKAESAQQDIPDPPGVQEEVTSPAPRDPIGMLTPEARATLASLKPFTYTYSVRNVAQKPPLLLADRSVYSGQWATTRSGGIFRKGKGKLYGSDGSYSEGYWLGPRLQSRGRLVYKNGDYYEGEIKDGRKHGNGVQCSYDGKTEYNGQWTEDMKHGCGTERLPDGSVYVGDFNKEKRTGQGNLSYANGKKYSGGFLDGLFDGKGVHNWPDGRYYDGTWKANLMHGYGKFISADKKVYEGEYKNDKKHGHGVFHFDGNIYDGPWVDGKMHGIATLTTLDRGPRKFEFKDNARGREIKSND